MRRWSVLKNCLILYDPMDQRLPLVRVTEVWPGVGQQHFDVRVYANGFPDAKVHWSDRAENLASAVAMAEDLLTDES